MNRPRNSKRKSKRKSKKKCNSKNNKKCNKIPDELLYAVLTTGSLQHSYPLKKQRLKNNKSKKKDKIPKGYIQRKRYSYRKKRRSYRKKSKLLK